MNLIDVEMILNNLISAMNSKFNLTNSILISLLSINIVDVMETCCCKTKPFRSKQSKRVLKVGFELLRLFIDGAEHPPRGAADPDATNDNYHVSIKH